MAEDKVYRLLAMQQLLLSGNTPVSYTHLKWAMDTGYLPVRTSAYESETYQEFMAGDATATASYAQTDAFFSSPAFDGSYDIQNAVNAKLEELILNKADSTTAMQELVDAVNGAL